MCVCALHVFASLFVYLVMLPHVFFSVSFFVSVHPVIRVSVYVAEAKSANSAIPQMVINFSQRVSRSG